MKHDENGEYVEIPLGPRLNRLLTLKPLDERFCFIVGNDYCGCNPVSRGIVWSKFLPPHKEGERNAR